MAMNFGRLALQSAGALLGIAYVQPMLAINGLATPFFATISVAALIAVAVGNWVGTLVADQFPATSN